MADGEENTAMAMTPPESDAASDEPVSAPDASEAAAETETPAEPEDAADAAPEAASAPAGKDAPSDNQGEDGDDEEPFDAPVRTDGASDENEDKIEGLIVNLDGYEGPLDVLLDLARTQKVDITRISMVALVDQYLAFVEEAKKRNLELAADYLVMASWLAFLKSKLLLPVEEESGDEPTADEMAARLAFQLQRLEAMRNAVEALQQRPQFMTDVFPRQQAEGVRVTRTADWQDTLYDLLKAYTTQRIGKIDREYHIEPPKVFSVEKARIRLARILGNIPEWTELTDVARIKDVDAPETSLIASAFNAALEFAKDGRIELRQMAHFEPIYIKASDKAKKQASDERTPS